MAGGSKPWLPLLAASLSLFLAGCETVRDYSLTYRLWNNTDMSKFSEPAPNPNLALFEPSNRTDVLVQYDAFSEKHETVRRQSYFLRANQWRTATGREPTWLASSATNGMKPIPLLSPESATNPALAEVSRAQAEAGHKSFVLYNPGSVEQKFDLPSYPETSGTPLRIALTPFAVAGDTIMVGGVCAVVGFIAWVYAGAPGPPPPH